jgi:hypothetical protein
MLCAGGGMKMNPQFKIEVCVTPNEKENVKQPYFWVLYKYCGDWCNENAGWAETSEKAWNDAFSFYKRYKSSH